MADPINSFHDIPTHLEGKWVKVTNGDEEFEGVLQHLLVRGQEHRVQLFDEPNDNVFEVPFTLGVTTIEEAP